MALCTDCIHHKLCYEYGEILDPIHGGVICEDFKHASNFVEVVRCKDCKYCDEKFSNWLGYHKCVEKNQCVRPNAFCSEGERKE